MSVKTKGFENGYEQLVSVATAATLEAFQVMGWDNLTGMYKPTPTAVTVTTTMATTANTALSAASYAIEYGSPEILSVSVGTAATKISTNYATKVITISSQTLSAVISIGYNMYTYDPCAMLSEGVDKAQTPGYAKMLLNGVVNDSDLYGTLSADTKARLAKNGVIVFEREEVTG
jgi:hypothetical protein